MIKRTSRRRTWLIVLAVVVALAVCAVVIFRPKKAKYRTAPVQRGNVTISVSATGTLDPVNQVTVGSQVSGTVENIYFDYNDIVKAGQTLATIDPRNYQAAVQQAKANLASAQAMLDQDQLTAARADTLYADKLMSYSDYLQAQTSLEVDRAKLQQAQASFDQAQTSLAYTTIVAPMSGVVVARKVDRGQTVAASFQAPELFNIADLSLMQVEVSIDEADVGKLDTGLTATFNVDAFPESTFSGKLVQVRNEPVTVSNVTTYIGIVRVENPHLILRPGMTANVKIVVSEADNVLTIPNAALSPRLASTIGFTRPVGSRRPGQPGAGRESLAGGAGQGGQRRGGQGRGPGMGRRTRPGTAAPESGGVAAPPETAAQQTKMVFVLEKDRPVPRQVQVGLADATNTEILSGLSEGEPVITGLGKNTPAAASQNRGSPFGFGGGPPRGR